MKNLRIIAKKIRKIQPKKAKNLIKKSKKKKEKQNFRILNEKSQNVKVVDENVEYVSKTLEQEIHDLEDSGKLNREMYDILIDVKVIAEKFEILNQKSTKDQDEELENTEFLEEEEEEESDGVELFPSKKEVKLKRRPTVAELKKNTNRPDVVDVWDCSSNDPNLLIWLKSCRNTIPVPAHWNSKRKYLQGKKGIEKTPFKLPDFIEATRIAEIRGVLQEKEANKTLKQKMRERVRPKMHKMDIDYQTLHDAFFKYGNKPRMTKFGDIYYEGKEFEERYREFLPGRLSDKLKDALGMTSDTSPPPWLYNMQKYGPPINYPFLPVPGVNAPIPAGADYGYHVGGWGEQPVDIHGKFIFGSLPINYYEGFAQAHDRNYWGEIDEILEEEEENPPILEDIQDFPENQIEIKTEPLVIETPYYPVDIPTHNLPFNPAIQPYVVLPQVPANPTGIFGSQNIYNIGQGVIHSVERETGFTAEKIREQLKFHEEKKQITLAAGKLIEPKKNQHIKPNKIKDKKKKKHLNFKF